MSTAPYRLKLGKNKKEKVLIQVQSVLGVRFWHMLVDPTQRVLDPEHSREDMV